MAKHALALGLGVVGALLSCHAFEPRNVPVDSCVRACTARASRQCSERECARGCEFVLDRIVEKETDNVLACVAKSSRRCSDVVWAECAVHIGVHADGGPPAPPAATVVDEE